MELTKKEIFWVIQSLDAAYSQALRNNHEEGIRNFEEIYAKLNHLAGRMFREEMDKVTISW